MDLKEAQEAPARRHPWEIARARFFTRVLADAGLLDAPRAVLDVGAGDGYLARTLLGVAPDGSTVVCFDANYTDRDLRRFAAPPRPGLEFVREVPARRFDVLLLLDVLEHVEDDVGFLAAVVTRHAARGAVVLISVPAWQALFSNHDDALAHRRRYSPAACRALLASAGLSIRTSGGLFHSLVLPRVLALAGERVRRWTGGAPRVPPNLGEWRGGDVVSRALERALAIDNAVSLAVARAGRQLPGLSFWALCDAPGPGVRGARP